MTQLNFVITEVGKKKSRTRTKPEQLQELLKLFEVNPLPTLQQRQELGTKLGMSPRAVQVWFQNRRQNLKKQQVRQPSPPVEQLSISLPMEQRSPRLEHTSLPMEQKSPRMSIDFLCDIPTPKEETEDIVEAGLVLLAFQACLHMERSSPVGDTSKHLAHGTFQR